MTTVLDVVSVQVAFRGLVALNDVSFRVNRGEVVGLLGPNGAGKTTLFDVISGIRRPTSGRIHVGGEDVTRVSGHSRVQRGVRRSFQTVGLAPALTAQENVIATIEAIDRVRAPYGTRSKARARSAAATEALASFGLEEVAEMRPTELPLGTTKRLELAKVFVGTPVLVLLDEPFAGVSGREAIECVEMIRARVAGSACTLLVVAHEISVLVKLVDRLVVLDHGTLIADGAAREVISNPEVRQAYFGAREVHRA